MKISFPTNDRKTIAKRTGRCKEFAIYELENGEIKNVDYLKNTHEHEDDHHHGHKKGEGERQHSHSDIMELLKDVDVLMVGRVGKYMKSDLQTSGLRYQLTKKIDIKEVIDEFLEGID
ncbi:MAG: NifB/NifX family molybdenum-iron cluster-binding protein [Bacteroidota bacterium]